MIKEILYKIFAILSVILLFVVLYIVYTFFSFWIMKDGISTILSPKHAASYLNLRNDDPVMNIFWINKKFGRAALFLSYSHNGDRPVMLPILKKRENFTLYTNSEKIILSKPHVITPYFFIGFSPNDEIFREGAYIIFDIPIENVGLFYQIIGNKEIVYGRFDDLQLNFKPFNSKIKFTEKQSLFDDLFLNIYFKLNAYESMKMLDYFSSVWNKYKPETASVIVREWAFKYYDFIFGSNE